MGGAWRFVLRGPDGAEMGMRGVYREIVRPERSVHTESFDDYPGESLVTAVFIEEAGKTTLTATVLYSSQEVRDAVIKSGMEHGAAESYDRLAELLATTTADIADRYRRVAGRFTEIVAVEEEGEGLLPGAPVVIGIAAETAPRRSAGIRLGF